MHPGLLHLLSGGRQEISYPSNRMDEFELKSLIDFFPKIVHIDINQISHRIKMIIPDVFRNHRSSQNLIWISHEIL